MSRGPDDIIREYLIREDFFARPKPAQVVAEEIEEALEAEGYMSVHRDSTLMFSPTSHLEIELSRRKDRSGFQDTEEVVAYWHAKHLEKTTGG